MTEIESESRVPGRWGPMILWGAVAVLAAVVFLRPPAGFVKLSPEDVIQIREAVAERTPTEIGAIEPEPGGTVQVLCRQKLGGWQFKLKKEKGGWKIVEATTFFAG